MNKELLKKLYMFISSSLIASSNLLLISCDDKVPQEESKKSSQVIKSVPSEVAKTVTESKVQNENVETITKVIEPAVKSKSSEQSKVDSNSSDSKEVIVVEETNKSESIILDLSLNFELDEKYYHRKDLNKKSLSGVFEVEEDDLNFEMETYFEWPHIENKELDTTPDGVGIGIKVGI